MSRLAQRGSKTSAGFTLVELMVIVAIIGILASLAVMSVDPDKKSRSTRGFAEAAASNFDFIRQRAVATQRVQRVTIAADRIDHEQAPVVGMLADYELTDITSAGTWETIAELVPRSGIDVASFDAKAHLTSETSVPAEGDGLPATLYFRPDGSVDSPGNFTGATFFVGNEARTETFRVVIFRVTGSVQTFNEW